MVTCAGRAQGALTSRERHAAITPGIARAGVPISGAPAFSRPYYTSWGTPKGTDEGKSAPDLSAIAHHRWGDLYGLGALKVAASPLKPPFSAGQGPFLFEGVVRRI